MCIIQHLYYSVLRFNWSSFFCRFLCASNTNLQEKFPPWYFNSANPRMCKIWNKKQRSGRGEIRVRATGSCRSTFSSGNNNVSRQKPRPINRWGSLEGAPKNFMELNQVCMLKLELWHVPSERQPARTSWAHREIVRLRDKEVEHLNSA